MPDEYLLDRYLIVGTAGQGGFSTVVAAWDTRLQRRVAIKRIPLADTDVDSQATPAGLAEARAAARLSDQHIVKVYDCIEDAGEVLIIMEYISGPDLALVMRFSTELLDIASIAAIASDVGSALINAHENKVLHLDIKPANILFDAKGHAKVTDFGMAVLTARHGTGDAQGGTVGYMPPEQIAGLPVDERSDLWAFAVLIYQLLTGRNPFMVASAAESLQLIETTPIDSPSLFRDDLDEGIDQVIAKALSADALWRHDSIGEFLEDLLGFLGSTRTGHANMRKTVALVGPGTPAEAMVWQAETKGGIGGLVNSARNQTRKFVSTRAGFGFRFGSGERSDPAGAGRPNDPAGSAGRPDDPGSTDRPGGADRWGNRDRSNPDPNQQQAKPALQLTLPSWRNMTSASRRRLTRLIAALAAMASSFVGLSGFGFLGLGGGGLATGQTWYPVGGNMQPPLISEGIYLSQSEFQLQLLVLLGVLLLIALVTAMVPQLGVLITLMMICAGIVARGLVFIGIALFAVALIWWLLIGRRGWPEAILMLLTLPLGWLFAPFAPSLLAAMFTKPLRATGTLVTGFLTTLTVAGLCSPLLSYASTTKLLNTGIVLASANRQFPPVFWQLLTGWQSWLILAVWLLSGICMMLAGLVAGRISDATAQKATTDNPSSQRSQHSQRSQRSQANQRNSRSQASGKRRQTTPTETPAPRWPYLVGAVLATILQITVLVALPFLRESTALGFAEALLLVKMCISTVLTVVLIQTGIMPYRSEELDPMPESDVE